MTLSVIHPDQIRIWTEDIPKKFAELLRFSKPLNVYISTPWISEFADKSIDLKCLLTKKDFVTILLTRPPRNEFTESFLMRLKNETRTRIYVNNRLHAKLYIIEGADQKYVVISSSNFTREARLNVEFGIVVCNCDIFTKRVIYSFLAYLKPTCKIWGSYY